MVAGPSKRRRTAVDYSALNAQLEKEGNGNAGADTPMDGTDAAVEEDEEDAEDEDAEEGEEEEEEEKRRARKTRKTTMWAFSKWMTETRRPALRQRSFPPTVLK